MMVKGIAASDGITINKVFKLMEVELKVSTEIKTNSENELVELKKALALATTDIEEIKSRAGKNLDPEHAMIFDAHVQIVNDPEMFNQIQDLIKYDKYNAAYAYKTVSESFATIFESMDNEYMRERAADVRDVGRRVIAHLLGVSLNDPSNINEKVIVVADDLTPSDTAQLNKEFVKGFITNIGGRTSHSAIMARSLEIPAVVGTKNILELVNDGDILILNGIEGYAIINPGEEEIKQHKKLHLEFQEKIKIWNEFRDKDSLSKDGVQVELAANIGSPEDMESAINNGAEGIGLYRTEF